MDLMAKQEQLGLVRRVRDSLRSYWSGPLTSNSPEIARLWATHPASSGVTVNENTALRYSAFFGAVNLISSQLATPPLFLLKRDEDNGKSRFPVSNPLYRLIHDRPNPEMSSFEWRKVMQTHALTWPGGFSEIERDDANKPVALWPLVPGRVRPFRATPDSDLQYLVDNIGGGTVILDRMDVIHIKGLTVDGVNGLSMVDQMSDSLGLGIAAERFGSGFYGNGASFGGVISYPNDPTDLVKKNTRETLAARHQGVQNAHRLLALYGGAKYEQIGIAPNLAQFLETRQFQVTEVARWFNIPPHKLGDLSRSTNNNIEQQDIDFYKSTMLPWFTAWEQELWYKLVPRLEQNLQIIEFFVDGLLRGDVAARGEFYAKQSLAGAITPNEIRSAENRNKIPGGDISLVPLNSIPLSLIEAYYQAEIDSKNAATEVAKRPPPEPKPPIDQTPAAEKKSLEEALQLARRTCQEAEEARDLARHELRLSEEQSAALIKTADQRTAEAQARHDAVFERLGVAEADLADAVRMTSVIEAEKQTAVEMCASAAKTIFTLEGERKALQERTESLSLDVAAAQQDVTRAEANAAAADHRTAVADAVVAELRTQLTTLTTDGEAQRVALDAVLMKVSRVEAERDEQQADKDALHALLELAQTQARQTDESFRAIKDALRGALAHSVDCIIRREADRARKAQGSPEKLLKHLEHFYPTHGEFCREALRPIIRAVAALDGTDANQLLDRIVPDMVEASTVQLRLVASDSDTETLAPALERVLRRWEAERGDAVADRLMREGLNYGR
jgi:HK97 family phage portal protein